MIKANGNVDTSLLTYACQILIPFEDVLFSFPEGEMEGLAEPEKGYDGAEVGFITDDGETFYVYARWGIARLACRNGWHNPRMAEFKRFIESKVGN